MVREWRCLVVRTSTNTQVMELRSKGGFQSDEIGLGRIMSSENQNPKPMEVYRCLSRDIRIFASYCRLALAPPLGKRNIAEELAGKMTELSDPCTDSRMQARLSWR